MQPLFSVENISHVRSASNTSIILVYLLT